jgi:hypothetical protein
MVSHDSLVRAEKRLGVPAVIGRYHKAPERQLQDDYQLGDKVEGWLGQAVQNALVVSDSFVIQFGFV